ncbi:MAG TPA: toxin glutamine deamidase domain-containing protein [Dongiaceae bacterium]|jgi:hypothetical protein
MVSLASGFFGPNGTRKAENVGAEDSGAGETGGDYPLGSWKDGKFSFYSPQAEAQWRNESVNSGVHFQSWDRGRKLNEKTRQLVELGFAPSADIYQGPDGDYYQMRPATREDPQVTALRGVALKSDPDKADIGTVMKRANAQIAPQALALMAQQAPISGASPATGQPANDNASSANDNSPAGDKAINPTDRENKPPASERPGLGPRFSAALEKGAMEGTVFGELAQELKRGKGYDPDYLATRIPDRFMQSPELQQAWRDMYAPLGIAGGKRKIDLVSAEERKLYETDWERLTPEQQVAYRKMSDAAKARYAVWRQGYESRTAMPPAQGFGERGIDFLGHMLGGLSSPENLVGIGEGEAAGKAGLEAAAALPGKALKAGEDVVAGAEKAVMHDGKSAATLGKAEAKTAEHASSVGNAEKGLYLSTRPVADQFPELAGINPHYVEGARPGVNTNCVSCVLATQRRLTGKNLEAIATPNDGYGGPDSILPEFPFGFRTGTTTPAAIEEELRSAGNGATGVVYIGQAKNVGHVLNVVNRHGTIYFIDSQLGRIVTLAPNLTVGFGVP